MTKNCDVKHFDDQNLLKKLLKKVKFKILIEIKKYLKIISKNLKFWRVGTNTNENVCLE
jgi:hypothetical protein